MKGFDHRVRAGKGLVGVVAAANLGGLDFYLTTVKRGKDWAIEPLKLPPRALGMAELDFNNDQC